MADKSKRPPRFDLKSADGSFGRLVQIGGTTIVVVFAVVLVFYIVTSRDDKKDGVAGPGDAVRVTSSKLVTQPGTSNPKAVVSFYEDFLCPACGIFERGFGPTVSKLVDIGAVAADYTMVAILDSASNQHYSSRAAAAAYCVADESIEAFRRFHAALFSKDIQPAELGKDFPDNARLIELAREPASWQGARLHQQRQVHRKSRRAGGGGQRARDPDGPGQWHRVRVVDAGGAGRQDQRNCG